MTTAQVDFWRGDFGNDYADRNSLRTEFLRARTAMWSDILRHTLTAPPQTILEVGANIGVNLRALRMLTDARFLAVEPNDKARAILVEDGIVAPPPGDPVILGPTSQSTSDPTAAKSSAGAGALASQSTATAFRASRSRPLKSTRTSFADTQPMVAGPMSPWAIPRAWASFKTSSKPRTMG